VPVPHALRRRGLCLTLEQPPSSNGYDQAVAKRVPGAFPGTLLFPPIAKKKRTQKSSFLFRPSAAQHFFNAAQADAQRTAQLHGLNYVEPSIAVLNAGQHMPGPPKPLRYFLLAQIQSLAPAAE